MYHFSINNNQSYLKCGSYEGQNMEGGGGGGGTGGVVVIDGWWSLNREILQFTIQHYWQSVNLIALEMICGAKYTHHTFTPIMKTKQIILQQQQQQTLG